MELYGNSDNQGVKEDTFIQTGRRGGDGQPDSRQGSGWQTHQGSGWWSKRSHICVQINQEEQRGTETDRTTQGSSREIKSQSL